MTKRRKTPQSTYNVSQQDLQGFYDKYLPKMGVGGRADSSFAYNTNLGKGADALSSVLGLFGNFKNGKYSKENNNNVRKSDYQKTSIKNNFDDDRYIDFGALNNADKNTKQGDIFKTWNQAMAHGITGVDGKGHTGMNKFLLDRSNILDNQGNALFAGQTYDENTGEIHYNPGQTGLVGNVAEENLEPWGAKSLTFNMPDALSTDKTSVVSYENVDGETTTYDPNNPAPEENRVRSDQEIANYNYSGNTQEVDEEVTVTDQNTSTDIFCRQNPELCPNRKMGGPLRMFFHGGSHDDEVEIEEPNLSPPSVPMIGMQPIEIEEPSMTPITTPSYNEMLEETPLNEAGSVDTSFNGIGGRLNYAKDKFMDSGAVKAFEDISSTGVKVASFANSVFDSINEDKKEIETRDGSTADALGTYASADSEGLRGDYDQLTGLLRPNDKVISRQGKYGIELPKANNGIETPNYKMIDFNQQINPEHNVIDMNMFKGKGSQEWMSYNPYLEGYDEVFLIPQQQSPAPENSVEIIDNVELEKTLKAAGIDRDLGEGSTEIEHNEDGTITPTLRTPLNKEEEVKFNEHTKKEKMMVQDELVMLGEMLRLKQENPLLSDDVIQRMANNNTYDEMYGLGYSKGFTKEQKNMLSESEESTLPYLMNGGSASLQDFIRENEQASGYNQTDLENVKNSLPKFQGLGGSEVTEPLYNAGTLPAVTVNGGNPVIDAVYGAQNNFLNHPVTGYTAAAMGIPFIGGPGAIGDMGSALSTLFTLENLDQFSKNHKANNKKKDGGQVVDIDEQLLEELRAAGADITIL